jgi:hypothetical protein
MHLVRSFNGLIVIEERDLVSTHNQPACCSLKSAQNVQNLCSGFSYCLSILDTLYVWHGRGSKETERAEALEYAQGLASNGGNVIELSEGENDDDEMFWMILGDEEYAKADHWRWRRTSPSAVSRMWRVDASSSQKVIRFPLFKRFY